MSATKMTEVALSLLLAGALACAGNTAPDGWLPSADEAALETYGGWISVDCLEQAPDCSPTHGELIGVGEDSLYVLTDDAFTAIPWHSVDRVTLTAYRSDAGLIAGWGIFGMLTTISHGGFLVISLPVWIITTSVAAAAQSRIPRRVYPDASLDELRMYARFPQGLPPKVPRWALRPKPPG